LGNWNKKGKTPKSIFNRNAQKASYNAIINRQNNSISGNIYKSIIKDKTI